MRTLNNQELMLINGGSMGEDIGDRFALIALYIFSTIAACGAIVHIGGSFCGYKLASLMGAGEITATMSGAVMGAAGVVYFGKAVFNSSKD